MKAKQILMLRNIGKKGLITILVFFLILLSIIFLLLIYSLSDYLSKTARVNANILLVEGWLPPYAIEMAYNEFHNNGYRHIITTGVISPEYYMLAMNGYLIFYTEGKISDNNEVPVHLIEVDAYSELEDKNSSHFNLYVNDSLVADFYADKHKKKYGLSWSRSLAEIDSITVQFDNDRHGDFGDRNLYIKEIIIDHKIIISHQNNSEYDIGVLDGRNRIINNSNSFAELAKNRLLSMGIDSTIIVAVPCRRVKINITLTSALAFRDWLKTTDLKVKGINIVSTGTHARRTWMTYTKVLNKTYNIGIISLPDYKNSHSRKNKILKLIRETVGIVYYWFILIPY